MGFIDVNGSNFTGSLAHLNKSTVMQVSIFEMIHAAVTYGFECYGKISISEVIKRVTILLSSLQKNSLKKYCKTITYSMSDPSEKTYISYVLGMISGKIIACKLLGFDWLVHYDTFVTISSTRIISNTNTKKRPDFIAVNRSGDFLVLEAKGTSDNINHSQITNGVVQKNTITRINGKNPLKVVAESYFSPDFSIEFQDPESDNGDEYEVSVEEFQSTYREHIMSLFHSNQYEYKSITIDKITYKTIPIPGTSIHIGLIDNKINVTRNIESRINEQKDIIQNDSQVFISNDGIAVISTNANEVDEIYFMQ